MKDKIRKRLRETEWTFNEIAQPQVLVKQIANIIYDGMSAGDKLKLVWNDIIDTEKLQSDGQYTIEFGYLYHNIVLSKIEETTATVVKDELTKATVKFKRDKNENSKNEIPKRSLGGKPHKERTTNEKKSSLDER